LTVLLVSLAGIPPTAGFFSKFYVFRAAVERNDLGLVAIGLLGALVSAYYYLRPVVAMYMQEPKETDVPEGPEDGERDWGPIAAAAIAIGIVLAIGLFPASTLDLAGRAVAGLVGR
jgi:NADH-quinone oxidoreductase subunit N